MTPQANFMVLAPLARGNVEQMRALLSRMNLRPGVVDPFNAFCPFGRLAGLHFARFVVLDDQTVGDHRTLYGIERPEPPVYLAFLGDFDGGYDAFLRELVTVAGKGLSELFSLCEGFSASDDLSH